MEYPEVRVAYDGARDRRRSAADRLEGLFPPRNIPIHLRTPALSHDHLAEAQAQVQAALADFTSASARLVDVAKRECPDVFVQLGPEEPFDESKLRG